MKHARHNCLEFPLLKDLHKKAEVPLHFAFSISEEWVISLNVLTISLSVSWFNCWIYVVIVFFLWRCCVLKGLLCIVLNCWSNILLFLLWDNFPFTSIFLGKTSKFPSIVSLLVVKVISWKWKRWVATAWPSKLVSIKPIFIFYVLFLLYEWPGWRSGLRNSLAVECTERVLKRKYDDPYLRT